MLFRLSLILFTGLLAVSLAFAGFFAVHHTHQINQKMHYQLSQDAQMLQAYLKHDFSISSDWKLLPPAALNPVFKHYKDNGKTALLVNRFGKILAHSDGSYKGHFLPLSSPLLPLLKQQTEGRLIRQGNMALAIRSIAWQPAESFIIVSEPTQQLMPVFFSYLKISLLLFLLGFVILWGGVFLYMRSFVRAGQFLLRLFNPLSPADSKRALADISHSNNPYLKSIRHALIPLLKTPQVSHKAADPEPCFSHLIEELIRKSKTQYPELSIQAEQMADTALPVFSRSLFQALWELVKNAAEAAVAQPKLMIRTFKKDHWFYCEVRDHGSGMDVATREKACELYFTTKAAHTGMGLSFAERVLARMGGLIHFHSPLEGPGVIVSFLIPLDYMDHVQNLKNNFSSQVTDSLSGHSQ